MDTFEVDNSQLFIEASMAIIYTALMLAQILLSFYAMRKRPGRGSILMFVGSLGVLLPGVLSFVNEYWSFHTELRDILYLLTNILAILTSMTFILGLYYFVTDSKKTTRLPIKENGLS